MTVSELIKILQQIESPEEVKILVNDTAAGYRDIDEVGFNLSGMLIVKTKKPGKK
jgi:hypothetical protein